MSRAARRPGGERGSALLLILGALLAALAGAVVLGALAAGVWAHGAQQRAADLAALAAARAMRDAYPRVFAPAVIDGRPNPEHLPTARLPRARPRGWRSRPRGATAPRTST